MILAVQHLQLQHVSEHPSLQNLAAKVGPQLLELQPAPPELPLQVHLDQVGHSPHVDSQLHTSELGWPPHRSWAYPLAEEERVVCCTTFDVQGMHIQTPMDCDATLQAPPAQKVWASGAHCE